MRYPSDIDFVIGSFRPYDDLHKKVCSEIPEAVVRRHLRQLHQTLNIRRLQLVFYFLSPYGWVNIKCLDFSAFPYDYFLSPSKELDFFEYVIVAYIQGDIPELNEKSCDSASIDWLGPFVKCYYLDYLPRGCTLALKKSE